MLNMQYVSTAVIVILVMAIVYLAVRKPKTKPGNY
jgi:preprotein translocase subunit YajC